MKELPLKLRIFVLAVIAMGGVLLLKIITQFQWESLSIVGFLVYLVLVIISDSLPVLIPRGMITVSFAIYYAAIITYGTHFAMLVAFLGDLFCSKKQVGKLPWYKDLFNKAQLLISVGLAGAAYQYFNPDLYVFNLDLVLGLTSSLIVFLVLNVSLVAIVVALAQDANPWQVMLVNMKWAFPNFIALAPLGYLIALIYHELGFWGIALFFIPLLIARHSFQAYMDVREMYLDTIQALAAAIDAKDPYTKGHSERVASYTVQLAKALKLPENQVEKLHYIALLHDVGKVGIQEKILNKPNRLTYEEFEEMKTPEAFFAASMKTHSVIGADIVAKVKRFQDDVATIKHHHERWDGKGYPQGLKGEEIPLGARVIAVADSFDAMTSDRPYRKAMPVEDVLKEIQACSGTQFDPVIVNIFLKIFPRISVAMARSMAATGKDAEGQEEINNAN